MLVASAILVACGGPGVSDGVPLDRELVLAPGMAAGGAVLRVTFERVANDSRCPADVQCVWEGDAVVVLAVSGSATGDCAVELHTAASLERERRCGVYAVRLLRLSPERASAAVPIPPASYRAAVIVSRVPGSL